LGCDGLDSQEDVLVSIYRRERANVIDRKALEKTGNWDMSKGALLDNRAKNSTRDTGTENIS
jgi:hypothetical protein